ncbi:MAG: selenide, water dikinase [Actinomycetota bacterium]|nr:selenide, water dikinase [Actinomycetota bacterium]
MNTTAHDPALLVGLEAPDDAAVYRVAPDLALVQTVDFFTPVVDDAFAWGRIAAANALSDVYAMGGRPVTALNLVAWPRSLGFDLLGRVIEGGGDACAEAGVTVVGGHSVDDPEPKFGLAVTGTVAPDAVVRTSGAAPGCDLVLTKPLGTGIISSGIKEGKVSDRTAAEATRIMSQLNRAAADAMMEVGVAAATDVTGFGLIGHLLEMLGPRLSAQLSFVAIPVMEQTLELARNGVIPGGTQRNLEAMSEVVDSPHLDGAQRTVLFDAQTSGGLLMAVGPERTESLVRSLGEHGTECAAVIGRLIPGPGTISVD